MQIENPLISIGLPTFNGSKNLAKVLDSICNQTYSNFELVISNNASSDNTESICLSYLEKDKRIKYKRQEFTVDIYKNFEFVLSLSEGKYFMWWADDDIRENNFLAECILILEKDEKCVAENEKLEEEEIDEETKDHLKFQKKNFKNMDKLKILVSF